MNNALNVVDESLYKMKNIVQSNKFVYGLVYLLLILYTVRLAPKLPERAVALINNSFFRLFIFVIILWTAKFDITTSILVSLAFMISMNYINNAPLWELLENVETTNPAVDVTIVPSTDLALDKVNNEQQVETPVVNTLNESGAVIVKPSVSDTGVVENPTIIVSPVVVKTQDGTEQVVMPNVQVASPNPPVDTVSAPVSAPVSQNELDSGCYPPRKVNIMSVKPYSSKDIFGS